MTNTLMTIQKWHQLARPTPDDQAFNVQLGCHLEEVCEMLETLLFGFPGTTLGPIRGNVAGAHFGLHTLATALKKGETSAVVTDREAFLDSLADQIVTAVGVGHCAGMDVPCAAEIVDQSNWTKFVDGKPAFDANGKISKPDSYRAPNLRGCF